MPETRLIAKLLATTAVTDLVGTRIRPLRLYEADTLPGLAVSRVSTIPCNVSSGATETYWVRVQITAVAASYRGARALAAAVKAALTPAGAAHWTDETGTPQITSTQFEGDYDLGRDDSPGEDTGDYMIGLDFVLQCYTPSS